MFTYIHRHNIVIGDNIQTVEVVDRVVDRPWRVLAVHCGEVNFSCYDLVLSCVVNATRPT
jgi:hypothetical protein